MEESAPAVPQVLYPKNEGPHTGEVSRPPAGHEEERGWRAGWRVMRATEAIPGTLASTWHEMGREWKVLGRG